MTPIKSTLETMKVGDKVYFPLNRRKSVRTTASDLKKDENLLFETKEVNGQIKVIRKG